MQNSDKIRSYLGFAARANKIVFGTERILMKKSVPVIVLGADAMQNTAKLTTKNINATRSVILKQKVIIIHE